MSSINRRPSPTYVRNHEGTAVREISAEKQLVRLTLANMLWNDQFYLDGQSSADLLAKTVQRADASFVAFLAEKARTQFKLRHVPLLLARELARTKKLTADVLNSIIQRPDEMSEFLAIYWKDGKTPLSNQVKKGLAKAFTKFNEYSLAKWDKNNAAISLRDVMFLVHPKPLDEKQTILFQKVANQELATPDTWETELSAGADKNQTFTRLMAEKKLGALAFLRNLRNMVQSGVSESLIRSYAAELDVSKVLPFRYIAAARIVPQFEDMLESMMLRSLATHEKMPGKTVLLIDNSPSMFGPKVSGKSDIDRFDAAAALAMLCREICEDVAIYSFANDAARVAPRRGFALREAIMKATPSNGTRIGKSVLKAMAENPDADRFMVFSDDESSDTVPSNVNGKPAYMINVASYRNGIEHGSWTTITGFSEAVIDYVMAVEKENNS